MAATRVIEIRTEIPGPRSREILERERHAVARPLIVHEPIVTSALAGTDPRAFAERVRQIIAPLAETDVADAVQSRV